MKRVQPYPETHQYGVLMIENAEQIVTLNAIMPCDFGVQIAEDGRVWICVNGISFLRFSPHLDGKMAPDE